MTRYVEFAVASNFSFLRGASHPEELMLQAAHARARRARALRPQFGRRRGARAPDQARAEACAAPIIRAHGSSSPTARPTSSPIRATAPAWGRLCRLLTRGNLRAEKGDCILYLDDLLEHIDGLELIVMERSTWELPSLPQLRKRLPSG